MTISSLRDKADKAIVLVTVLTVVMAVTVVLVKVMAETMAELIVKGAPIASVASASYSTTKRPSITSLHSFPQN